MLVLDDKSFEDMKCVYKSLHAELCPSQHLTPLIKVFLMVRVCAHTHTQR